MKSKTNTLRVGRVVCDRAGRFCKIDPDHRSSFFAMPFLTCGACAWSPERSPEHVGNQLIPAQSHSQCSFFPFHSTALDVTATGQTDTAELHLYCFSFRCFSDAWRILFGTRFDFSRCSSGACHKCCRRLRVSGFLGAHHPQFGRHTPFVRTVCPYVVSRSARLCSAYDRHPSSYAMAARQDTEARQSCASRMEQVEGADPYRRASTLQTIGQVV